MTKALFVTLQYYPIFRTVQRICFGHGDFATRGALADCGVRNAEWADGKRKAESDAAETDGFDHGLHGEHG